MMHLISMYGVDFLTGFGWTLLSSVIALVGSLILGTLFAIIEVIPRPVPHYIARLYIEVLRNIPLLVITMFFYIVVSGIFKINGFVSGTIGLTLYTSAFIAETVKAGIYAVPTGQYEGGRANGLSWWETMRMIVLPQAFKYVIPPLGNQFVNLVKNSSVLAFVAGFDLMYQANQISQTTFDTFNPYIIVGILYLVITLPISYYMRYLEDKLVQEG